MTEIEELKERVHLLEGVVDKLLDYVDNYVPHNATASVALDKLHGEWLNATDDLPLD